MTEETGKYRLGLDLGTNSIGWAAIKLDDSDVPCGILDMGVRVFPDGRKDAKSGAGASLAVERREARSARRRRKRYVRRRGKLMQELIACGLMPSDERERKQLEECDPYQLRARSLDHPLTPYELGRALFHLNQRRGFKSNRKTEQRGDDTGPVKEAAEKLKAQMSAQESRTLGEFLYKQRGNGPVRERKPVRFRNLSTGTKAKYEFYPTREMLWDEFNKIWEAQTSHHQNLLTSEAKKTIEDTIFHQRDLIAPPVGKCTLDSASDKSDHDGFRCSWAHPLAQRFRIWEEVRNLEVQEVGGQWRKLRKEEGDRVANALLKTNKVKFDKIRKLLGYSPEAYFNLESERRQELLGDQTAAKLSHKDLFGKEWREFSLDKKIEIVERLLEKDEDDAVQWLADHMEISSESAKRIASAHLPDGHCRLGLRAIRKMLPFFEEGFDYARAAEKAGYDHAKRPTGELSLTGFLPYYGEWLKDHLVGTGDPQDPLEKRYGRYPNPTVHVGLNQLRRVVNALIKKYGRPYQIVVETTRHFPLSQKQREDLEKEQRANQKKNEERDKKIREIRRKPNYENRLKMRLWEELNPNNPLDRRCVFTGKCISLNKLFSDEIEIEHLIPWQDSWDDSPTNKTVSFRSANRAKGKKTPYDAFHMTQEWNDILQRADKLPKNKRKRFGPDALQLFKEQGGFLNRQLNETGWLARLSKEYLSAVVPAQRIWVTPGRLTATVRYKWGLNELLPGPSSSDAKKRTDHRHHAIDAFVVALTDRSLLQRMSRAYDETRKRIKVPGPWEGFRDELKRCLDSMVISYKPNRPKPGKKRNAKRDATSGQLHDATAYGLFEHLGDERYKVVYRKPLERLTKKDLKPLDDYPPKEGVRDIALREALWNQWMRADENLAAFVQGVKENGVVVGGKRQDVRRVRVVKDLRVIPMPHRNNPEVDPYKAYEPGSNAFADVWRMQDGSWKMVVVPAFYANRPNFNIESFRPKSSCAELIMRLYRDDMGALGEGDNLRIVRLRKITNAKVGAFVVLDPHNEANVPDRVGKDMKENRYKAHQLQAENFRKIDVDEIGRVLDPGLRSR